MRIVILGAHLTGIGTQASMLAKTLRVPQFSPGDILRDAIDRQTAAGKIAQQEIRDGALLCDDTIQMVVIERLDGPDGKDGFILHEYPETVRQAVALDETLRQKRLRLDAVVELTGLEKFTKDCLAEPTPSQSVGPVANYYWNQQRLIVVDALSDYNPISKEICNALALNDIV